LKAWLQRYYALQRTFENIRGFFKVAIEANTNWKLEHYRACFIRVD